MSWIDRLLGPLLDKIGQSVAGQTERSADPVEELLDDDVALSFENFNFDKHWTDFCEDMNRQERSASKSAAWKALSQMPTDAVRKLLTLEKFDFDPKSNEFDGLGAAGLLEISRSRERYYSRLWIGAFAFFLLICVISFVMGGNLPSLLGVLVIIVIGVFATDWLNRRADGTTDVLGEISWTRAGMIFAKNELFPKFNKYLREKGI
ncbi:hypothetical protein [Ruegeria sp. HKCCD8929]|uniref:hypothetical protein n=1 Tax=Ruegeria sp. HKCCD8929 TaxID=2683006 RepID=UPI001487E178|nr:hypothetical protein [Ruegeria sp. HKCCD8929]